MEPSVPFVCKTLATALDAPFACSGNLSPLLYCLLDLLNDIMLDALRFCKSSLTTSIFSLDDWNRFVKRSSAPLPSMSRQVESLSQAGRLLYNRRSVHNVCKMLVLQLQPSAMPSWFADQRAIRSATNVNDEQSNASFYGKNCRSLSSRALQSHMHDEYTVHY